MYTYITLALLCIVCAYGARVGGQQKMTEAEIMAAKDLIAGLDLQVENFNKLGKREFRVVRHSIIGATRQVVAGFIYRVKVNMVESTCKNIEENVGKSIELCPAKDEKMITKCIVNIWSRQWLEPSKRLQVRMKCLRN